MPQGITLLLFAFGMMQHAGRLVESYRRKGETIEDILEQFWHRAPFEVVCWVALNGIGGMWMVTFGLTLIGVAWSDSQ